MTNSTRDEFTQSTKDILAKRVAFLCSNPDCRHITIGPHSNKNKFINTGVAAHIKAAAPGGKRYDPSMTPEERMDISNGIWLCQSCSKLIDSDEEKYTVELLHRWKADAEKDVLVKISSQIEEKELDYMTYKEYSNVNKVDENYVLMKLEQLINQVPSFKKDLQVIMLEIKRCNFDAALDSTSGLYKMNNDTNEIWIWLNFVIGNYDKVVEEVNINNMNSEFALRIAGKSDMMAGGYNDAIEKLTKANEIQETYECNLLLLKCYEFMENREERIRILQKLESFPNNKDITYYELGSFYMYSKDSIEYFSKSIQWNGKLAEAYLEKGKVERYYGEWEKAIDDLEIYLEISGDYTNAQVLLELAMSYYNKGDINNVYLSRYIDNILNSSIGVNLENAGVLPFIDIGDNYTNIMLLMKRDDDIFVNINGNDIMKTSFKNRGRSGIGLYLPPTNVFLLKYGSDKSEEEIAKEASLPALFKIYDNNEEYEAVKQDILSENVLHINHKSESYEEYVVEKEDIHIDIINRLKGLNATIKIGNYIIDEWFMQTGEGLQAFRSKLSQETMFNEAVVVLIGPKQECQLTFKKDQINIIDK
ncbi:MAG: hypothetical protein J1E98_15200 [Lachnospiraceae bacterium]|nr:hypothetical protein [Lachnospiraceae bacterium]